MNNLKKQKVRTYKSYTVDIITPVYGGLFHIKRLAESMLKYDAGVDWQWIIVDDATPAERGRQELIEYLRELTDLHDNMLLVQCDKNGGYSKANNIGVSKGRANHILLLNSDTIIFEEGWLKRMMDNFEEDPRIGIVGAKLLYPPDSEDPLRPAGKVQHAGVVFNLLGEVYHIFMGWPADHPKVNTRRELQVVTGACLLVRKTVWNSVGGLSEVYVQGNFEDVEFGVRTRFRGYKVVYDPTVQLYHHAGGSDNTAMIRQNWQVFNLRNNHIRVWDDYLHW